MIDGILELVIRQVKDKSPYTIGIFGHGASGKTTFAKALVEKLGEDKVNLLVTDPYIISGEKRLSVRPCEDFEQKVTACMPIAHESQSLTRDILSLQSGHDLLTINTFYSPSQLLKASKPILIVEGMSVAFLEKSLFDLMICFYTDDETELKRRLVRDTVQRGRDVSFVCQTSESRREQYRRYYKPMESKADILVKQTSQAIIVERTI